MAQRIITIIGGTGFVGRYVVKLLAASGYTLRIVSRHPEDALHLKTAGDVGQIVLTKGDITKPQSLQTQLEGSYAVINLAGILFESGGQRFTKLHAQGAEKLAQMAKAAGVERFIHISSLGVDKAAGSQYALSKMRGEKGVQAAFPSATILRPSVIFGPEDNFFNQFADMASKLPFLPLFGGGKSRFQPVYVGDVSKAIAICLTRENTQGQVYELGGPNSFSFKELFEYILKITGRTRKLVVVPFPIASLFGRVCELIPLLRRPLLTQDQVTLLKYDSVVSVNAKGFTQLGISPSDVGMVVPEYLARFRKNAKDQHMPAHIVLP